MVNIIENLLKDKLCYFISVFVETRNRRSVVDVTRQFDEISLQIPKCELIFYLQNDNVFCFYGSIVGQHLKWLDIFGLVFEFLKDIKDIDGFDSTILTN